MTRTLIRSGELDGELVDIELVDTRVGSIEAARSIRPVIGDHELVVEARGGAVLAGLHDHHIHLLSLAARAASLDLGADHVKRPSDLDVIVRAAMTACPPGAWIRAVGYAENRGGPIDRSRIDDLAPEHPIRIQHRSGSYWFLNSAGLAALGPLEDAPRGVERDDTGNPTGRVWRADDWLRSRVDVAVPDLAGVGARLAELGITGVTDATPTADRSHHERLADACRDGTLPVSVTVTGGPELTEVTPRPPLRLGPVKLVVGDHETVDPNTLADAIRSAHAAERPVAVHCVSRPALALALAAWLESGARRGDRVEHAGLADRGAVRRLVELGLTVVTQPGFIDARGDDYLVAVDADDLDDLYRCGSLLRADIPVGGSSDAPFGPLDPWKAMGTAVRRQTRSGRVLGRHERVTAAQALRLYLGPLDDPGGPPRHIEVGCPADLCCLDRPLALALADPSAGAVATTFRSGQVSFCRERAD